MNTQGYFITWGKWKIENYIKMLSEFNFEVQRSSFHAIEKYHIKQHYTNFTLCFADLPCKTLCKPVYFYPEQGILTPLTSIKFGVDTHDVLRMIPDDFADTYPFSSPTTRSNFPADSHSWWGIWGKNWFTTIWLKFYLWLPHVSIVHSKSHNGLFSSITLNTNFRKTYRIFVWSRVLFSIIYTSTPEQWALEQMSWDMV